MNDILEYKGCFVDIHYSANDEVFFGKLLGINDLISFEGDSVKQLKEAFHEAVEDYLETCNELGKEPGKTCKGTFNVRIPSKLHRLASLVADVKKVSLNDFVRYSIDEAIAKEKKQLITSLK